MWVFTGGCHIAFECTNYKIVCGECPFLRKPGKRDLSYRLWLKKKKLLENKDFTVITVSKWLQGCASSSALLTGKDIRAIPNPLDHNRYCPSDKKQAKKELSLDQEKRHIMFGAANVRSMLKGFDYFLEALRKLALIPDAYDRYEVILYGKSAEEIVPLIPFVTHGFDYIASEEKIITLYNAADVCVVASRLENMPNTILESFACGTPVAAFNTGGIGEMIEHKINGYLAEYLSSDDLAHGIQWILEHDNYQELSQSARQKVISEYSEKAVAEKYRLVYEELLNQNE
jgi:glycosyltransferase involved in cell wall biosynthesis